MGSTTERSEEPGKFRNLQLDLTDPLAKYELPTQCIRRPKEFNSSGQAVVVAINSFPVVAYPNQPIYQYDVSYLSPMLLPASLYLLQPVHCNFFLCLRNSSADPYQADMTDWFITIRSSLDQAWKREASLEPCGSPGSYRTRLVQAGSGMEIVLAGK